MRIKRVKSDIARNRWRDVLDQVIAGNDIVIERYNRPVAVVIPYEEYLAVQEQLDDLRAAHHAQTVLEEYRRDPSSARPYAEIRAELIEAGLLDDEEPLRDPLHAASE